MNILDGKQLAKKFWQNWQKKSGAVCQWRAGALTLASAVLVGDDPAS